MEQIYFINNYLQIMPLNNDEVVKIISDVYDTFVSPLKRMDKEFIEFLDYFMYLYLNLLYKKTYPNVVRRFVATCVMSLDGQPELHQSIRRFVNRHYRSVDWSLRISDFLKQKDGEFFLSNPELRDFIGIHNLICKMHLPERVLRERLETCTGTDHYIALMNILTYQKPSEELVRTHATQYPNDQQLKHVAMRYQRLEL